MQSTEHGVVVLCCVAAISTARIHETRRDRKRTRLKQNQLINQQSINQRHGMAWRGTPRRGLAATEVRLWQAAAVHPLQVIWMQTSQRLAEATSAWPWHGRCQPRQQVWQQRQR